MSNEFKKFYASEGIQRELIAPHNPLQNGVVERKNKSIVGVAQVILHDRDILFHLWDEACNTVVYVHNKSRYQIVRMSTRGEYFSRNKPYVSHFRIFGSLVYCHVTKNERKNIELIAELGIFVGYTDTPHNYRVYLPSHRMTMVHRDVKFNEEKAMRCSLEREIQLHADEELLAPKEEPQDNVSSHM